MQLTEICNLPYAELKQRKDELIALARKASVEDLATRFLQSLTDAKQRDEKLAEQATTLAALTSGNKALEEKVAGLVADAAATGKAHAATLAERDKAIAEREGEIVTLRNQLETEKAERGKAEDHYVSAVGLLQSELAAEQARCQRLKGIASRNHAALQSAHATLAKAVVDQAIEAADSGTPVVSG